MDHRSSAGTSSGRRTLFVVVGCLLLLCVVLVGVCGSVRLLLVVDVCVFCSRAVASSFCGGVLSSGARWGAELGFLSFLGALVVLDA